MGLATANFTPEEENLIQLLPPAGPIDSAWISEADTLISGKRISNVPVKLQFILDLIGFSIYRIDEEIGARIRALEKSSE